MPTAIQQHAADTDLVAATREIASSHGPRDAALENIFALLATAPADLGRISETIRQYPDLSALVLRMADSLFLAPENSLDSLEQAVVVLGTGRLRVLIQLWSKFRESEGLAQSAGILTAGASPESLYIAAFLAWAREQIPMAAQISARSGRAAVSCNYSDDCSEVFVRDFFALLPLLEAHPSIRPATKACAAASQLTGAAE